MNRIVVLLITISLLGCISSHEDYEIANKVAKYLSATGVVPADTREADRTHRGKIVYFSPGVNKSPHFTYYEVTSPAEMQKLKRAAEEALEKIPEARKVTLHFKEKQVFHQSPDGSGYRGDENELKTIVINR